MAKKSSIVKNKKKKLLAKKYHLHREALRAIAVNLKLSFEERQAAQIKLNKLPKNTSSLRVVSRCEISGRPRGVYKKFGLSRIAFRDLALEGRLPGVTKASW